MKYIFVLLGAVTMYAQQPPAETDPVVLTVGSEKITKSQFEQILAALPDQARAQAQSSAGKKQIAVQLSELMTMAQEARSRKLDQNPKVRTQIALQTDQVLAQNLYQDIAASNAPTEADLHTYYDQHKKEYEEVKAKHILIHFQGAQGGQAKADKKELTEAEALAKANDIRAKILAGSDFDKLAASESDDPGTAPHGGELGVFTKGRMVPQFEQAAFAAEPGKVTEPVKSPFGYHLILVESHSTRSFDEMKPEIQQKLKPEMARKGVDELKKKTPVTFDESYFGK